MRKTRRIAAMIAAMALTATMAVPGMMMSASAALPSQDAEGGVSTGSEITTSAAANTITINQGTSNPADKDQSHVYKAYQIFTGTAVLNEAGNAVENLSGIDWAEGITGSAVVSALKSSGVAALSTLGDDASAAVVANALKDLESDKADARAVAMALAKANCLGAGVQITSGEANALTDGYYLILDTADLSGKEQETNTFPLLTLYDDGIGLTITTKIELPTVEKKVKENSKSVEYNTTDTEAIVGTQFNDVADYNIGDTVEFELIGDLPTNINDYETYKYVFHDTLGKQFTLADGFQTTGVSVKIGTNKENATTVITPSSVTVGDTTATGQYEGGKDITITFNDLKSVIDAAETGAAKENGKVDDTTVKVYVTYSATLNSEAVIGRDGQNNKVYLEYSNNPSKSGSGENQTGKTPEDQVVVFTYELDVIKKDAYTNAQLADAKFVLYRMNGTDKEYAIWDASTKKITGWVAGTVTKSDNATDGFTFTPKTTGDTNVPSVVTSSANAAFDIKGLDDGTYYLTETVAPTGYTLPTKDVTFKISATTENGQDKEGVGTNLTAISLAVTDGDAVANNHVYTNPDDDKKGIVDIDVNNTSSSALPSTGGMGTYLFYGIGGAIALGAGVVLVSKKRAKEEQ